MKTVVASLALLLEVCSANAQGIAPAQQSSESRGKDLYIQGCVDAILKRSPDTTKAEATKTCEDAYAKSPLSK
jgi:hypothetical protein